MQHLFEKLIRRHHVLGSAVLIASSGQMSLICTSSENPKHRASPDTYFRVASITKTATAVLCMRLADRGLLDLDCPVNELFHDTDVGSTLKGITLSHLLSHTSGVIDPPGLESYLEQDIPFADFLPSALQGRLFIIPIWDLA